MIPYTNYGASNFTAFITLYAVASYIRRKKISFQNQKKRIISLIVFPYMFAVISIIGLDLLGTKIPLAAKYSCYYMRGDFRPVSMLVSIGIFIWSINWKIKTSKMVNFIAAGTFGTYLIHMYPAVMRWLFETLFNMSQVVNTLYAVPYLIGVTVLILLSGIFIDFMRRNIFEFFSLIRKKINKTI